MSLKVKYLYNNHGVIKENTISLNDDVSSLSPYDEVDNILIPLIKKETGHRDIKIVNYGVII